MHTGRGTTIGRQLAVGVVMRYDAVQFEKPTRTANGYLRCDATLTRVGVFEYRKKDGQTRRELRLPDEVFHADALGSFELVPLTNNHPREPLTSRNTRRYQAGTVQDIRRDGEHIGARILITDEDAIAAVEAGKRQLSCGYTCDLEQRPGFTAGIEGVQDGLRYDAIQRNIVGNHVAIVDRARAGATATIHLDADDAVMVTDTNPTGPAPGPEGKPNMGKVRIDGIDFEMEDAAAQAVTMVIARRDELETATTTAAAQLSAEQARADKAEEELAAEKKAREDSLSDDAVRDLVATRVALVTAAAKVMGDDFKADDLSADDIKRAVVLQVSPAAKEKLDAADAAYVNARFDAAIEKWQADQDKKPSASQSVRHATAPGTQSAARYDAAEARRRMVDHNQQMGISPIRPTTPDA